MQIHKVQAEQNSQEHKKQLATRVSKEIWRKKINCYLYPAIAIQHVCNIEDTIFMNQKSLRDPEHHDESFLKTIFYFKSVGSVSVNQNYLTLHLKKRDQSYLPKQYFIERLKSFGNRDFYEIAIHLQRIGKYIKEIKEIRTKEVAENFTKENEEKILTQSLEKLEKKKFLGFFLEFTPQGSSLSQIILSKSLLSALGYEYEDIAIDFLKYQEAVFEIISANLYFKVMEHLSHLLDNVFASMIKKPMTPEEVKELTTFRFNDDLIPKASADDTDFDRKIRSRIKFSKMHPSVSIFEIERMNRKERAINLPENKFEQERMKVYKAHVRERELDSVKNILKVSGSEPSDPNKKMCSYKVIREEPVIQKPKKRIEESSSESEYLGYN